MNSLQGTPYVLTAILKSELHSKPFNFWFCLSLTCYLLDFCLRSFFFEIHLSSWVKTVIHVLKFRGIQLCVCVLSPCPIWQSLNTQCQRKQMFANNFPVLKSFQFYIYKLFISNSLESLNETISTNMTNNICRYMKYDRKNRY